jgi:hypothetical protein
MEAEWLVAPQRSSFMDALVSTVTKLEQQVSDQEQALSQLQRVTYYPICIKQLLVLADNKIRFLTNTTPPDLPLVAAPHDYAMECLDLPKVELQAEDLNVIYVNLPGSVRGDGNVAAHEIPVEDQEAAVRSYPDAKMRQSLARIFKFTHGREVTGL